MQFHLFESSPQKIAVILIERVQLVSDIYGNICVLTRIECPCLDSLFPRFPLDFKLEYVYERDWLQSCRY